MVLNFSSQNILFTGIATVFDERQNQNYYFWKAMFSVLENIFLKATSNPQDVAIWGDSSCMTYGQLEELSGRVYGFLQKHHVGREDVVFVKLRRRIEFYACMVGIWRAGAVLAGLEDEEPQERESFIRRNCSPKIVIHEGNLKEVFDSDYREGYEPRDLHDGAFVVYTSGSTGNPKGALHEYGTLEYMALSNVKNEKGEAIIKTLDNVAITCPMNYLPSYFLFVWSMSVGATCSLVPYEKTKNLKEMQLYVDAKKISVLFITPTYAALFEKIPPSIRCVILAAEIVKNIWFNSVELLNMYGSTEFGTMVTTFAMKGSMENTPIGKDFGPVKVETLEDGEVRVYNPYARGYINNEAENAIVFKEGWIYPGDIAQRTLDGDLTIVGRKNEMVKIDGNRVEPGEIEAAVKKVLGVSWACVRVVKNERNAVSICVYYVDDISFSQESVQKKISLLLPYYMVPTHYIHIDSIPKNANGKLNKLALPLPSLEEENASFVPPKTEEERTLCKTMGEVLNVENVGLTTDFFQLGGTSVSAMRVVAQCDLEGLGIHHIYQGRTPEKILKLLHHALLEETPRHHQTSYPLLPTQRYIWNFQMRKPQSTMYNIYSFFELRKEVDLERLAVAIKSAVRKHRALLTTFEENAKGQIVQRISEDEVSVEEESCDLNAFSEIRNQLVQPFDLLNDPLYRIRIFKVEERAFLFMDVHHIVFDGSSLQILYRDIEALYRDEERLEEDYESLLLKKLEQVNDDSFRDSLAYFENVIGNKTWDMCPRVDSDSAELDEGELMSPADLDDAVLDRWLKTNGVSRNEFFTAVTLKAIALYNGTENVLVNWVYKNRDTVQEDCTVGPFYACLPVVLEGKMEHRSLVKSVAGQIEKGIAHANCQYVLYKNDYQPCDCVCLLYQGTIRSSHALEGLVCGRVDARKNAAKNQNILDVEVLETAGGCLVYLDYDSSKYEKSSMERFLAIWKKTAREFLAV